MIYCAYGNILNFPCMSRIHFSWKLGHWNHWANGANNLKIHPSPWAMWTPIPYINACPLPHSPRQTTAQLVHVLPHNYATKAPLVTMERPTFILKTAPSLRRQPPHLIHPSLDQPHSPPKWHLDLLSRFTTIHFVDWPTDRQTDRPKANVPYDDCLR